MTMPETHRVSPDDCISSIALRYGFSNHTIWNHPQNRDLRERRGDPDVLLPGDKLYIPDLTSKSHSAAVDTRHRFRRRSVPAKFTMVLRRGDEPRANIKYRLDLDGRLVKGSTNAKGVLEAFIPPNITRGRLFIDDTSEHYTLEFGRLDPVSEDSGVRQRLENLRYVRPNASRAALDRGVIKFKEDHCGLEIKRDGTATDDEVASYPETTEAFRKTLVRVHGS